jgi:hypothetical protein
MRNGRHAFVPWLIRLAIDGQQLPIFGDGQQMRDFTYVDDVVEALLASAYRPESDGEVFNLGGERPYSLREFVEILLTVVGGGSYALVPFPEDRRRIDIGSYYGDYSKIKRVLTAADGAACRGPTTDRRVLPRYGTTTGETAVPFLELSTQYRQIKSEIDRAIRRPRLQRLRSEGRSEPSRRVRAYSVSPTRSQ